MRLQIELRKCVKRRRARGEEARVARRGRSALVPGTSAPLDPFASHCALCRAAARTHSRGRPPIAAAHISIHLYIHPLRTVETKETLRLQIGECCLHANEGDSEGPFRRHPLKRQ
jgi:hypothetical protein